MKLNIKLLLSFVLVLGMFTSMPIDANDEELVCYYQENENGELEYVCANPNEVEPCQGVCLPPCKKPEDE